MLPPTLTAALVADRQRALHQENAARRLARSARRARRRTAETR